MLDLADTADLNDHELLSLLAACAENYYQFSGEVLRDPMTLESRQLEYTSSGELLQH